MADAVILIVTPSIISMEYPVSQEKYQGYVNMFAGIGLGMGPVIASICQIWLEYIGIMYVFAVLIFLVGITSACFVPRHVDAKVGEDEEDEPMVDVPYGDFLKNPRVFMALLVYFSVAIFYMFYDTILSLRLLDIGVKKQYVGLGFALTDSMSSIGAPFIGCIAGAIDNRIVILVSLIIIAVSVLLSSGLGDNSIMLTYVGLSLLGIGVAGIWVPIMPEIIKA